MHLARCDLCAIVCHLYSSKIHIYFVQTSRALHLSQTPTIQLENLHISSCSPHFFSSPFLYFCSFPEQNEAGRLVFLSAHLCLSSRTEWKWIKHDQTSRCIYRELSWEFERKRKTYPFFLSLVWISRKWNLLCVKATDASLDFQAIAVSAVKWFETSWCNSYEKEQFHLWGQLSGNLYIDLLSLLCQVSGKGNTSLHDHIVIFLNTIAFLIIHFFQRKCPKELPFTFHHKRSGVVSAVSASWAWNCVEFAILPCWNPWIFSLIIFYLSSKNYYCSKNLWNCGHIYTKKPIFYIFQGSQWRV